MITLTQLQKLDSYSLKKIDEVVEYYEECRRELKRFIEKRGADAWKDPATYEYLKKYFSTGRFYKTYKQQMLEILEQMRVENLAKETDTNENPEKGI